MTPKEEKGKAQTTEAVAPQALNNNIQNIQNYAKFRRNGREVQSGRRDTEKE